jgi:acetolactate synthase-1/2/3 large subunit
VKDVLSKLSGCLDQKPEQLKELIQTTDEWRSMIDEWKERHPMTYRSSKSVINPQFVIEKICELTDNDAIITTEVGQHQMWAAQFFSFRQPRTFLTSGGLGTMGFGLPAALGAQVAYPDRQVIDISGDGSFQMNSQEMATLVQYKLPVKIIILNNNYLGMVRQWQQMFFKKRYSQTVLELPIDFVKLAEAYGATGFQTTKVDEVEAIIKQTLETPGPVLVNFEVSREENVLPMVPAGKAIHEMVLAS